MLLEAEEELGIFHSHLGMTWLFLGPPESKLCHHGGRPHFCPGVENKVLFYLSAIFNGRHAATTAAAEPKESRAFPPLTKPTFLFSLMVSSSSPKKKELLEVPFTLPELALAVEKAAGLSYCAPSYWLTLSSLLLSTPCLLLTSLSLPTAQKI